MAPSIDVYGADDPLAFAIRPPSNETPEQRQVRLENERRAKEISDRIDRELLAEREALKKKKGSGAEVKLLLLGQSESGKSTLQKQFQMIYAPQSLEDERLSWRPVVFLNVVKSVKTIINALDYEDDGDMSDLGYSSSQVRRHADDAAELANLRLRLLPLLILEDQLSGNLAGASHITVNHAPVVRSGWQSLMRSKTLKNKGSSGSGELKNKNSEEGGDPSGCSTADGQTVRMLMASQGDVQELWTHPCVKSMIKRRKLRLEDSSAFFLDNIERISKPEYVPTIDDILRCRLQTLGIAEHVFQIKIGSKPATWRLYDVGGSRGQRASWAPYFEDANAIIFLAPISAYDQYLEEDHRVNRVDDSLQLFIQVCSNSLLKNAALILFLNKTDLLRTKLKLGVRVKKYITSFGDRPNEYDEASQYFKAHFSQAHRKHGADKNRTLFIHMTSVVDTATTTTIIHSVRDGIFRNYLKDTSLI